MSFCIRHNNCATKTHFMLSPQGNAIGWWIWVNYNNSHTWNKAVVGYFPIRTMIQVTSQWGRYNVPKWMMFADVDDVDDDHDDNDHEIWNMKYEISWNMMKYDPYQDSSTLVESVHSKRGFCCTTPSRIGSVWGHLQCSKLSRHGP